MTKPRQFLVPLCMFSLALLTGAVASPAVEGMEARRLEIERLIQEVDQLAENGDVQGVARHLHQDYLNELGMTHFEPPQNLLTRYWSPKQISVLQIEELRLPGYPVIECIVKYTRKRGHAEYYVVYIVIGSDGYVFRNFPMLPLGGFVNYNLRQGVKNAD